MFCDSQVIIGAAYDQKVDLWSLGCVLAELYSGEVLLHNDSLASLLGKFILTLVRAIRVTGKCFVHRRPGSLVSALVLARRFDRFKR